MSGEREPDVVVALVADGSGGYDFEVHNPRELPDEIVAQALRHVADDLLGVNDRARGCW